jgi:hypothetical protein
MHLRAIVGAGDTVTGRDDDVQAAGDDLRTLVETSLIVQDPPPAGWRPRDEDLA